MYRFIRFLPTKWWQIQSWKDWIVYVKWRSETYGCYNKDGSLNKKHLWMMIKQMRSYHAWLGRMDQYK